MYIYIINTYYRYIVCRILWSYIFSGPSQSVPGISFGTLAAWLRSKRRGRSEEWKSPEICNEKDEVLDRKSVV